MFWTHWRNWLKPCVPAPAHRRGPSRPRRGSCRPRLEPLEDRTVPSNIVWVNRGNNSGETNDRINEVFCVNTNPNPPTCAAADAARAVVDAALNAWDRVIVNLNQQGGLNRLDVTIRMDSSDQSFSGSAGVDTLIGNKPRTGSITLGRAYDLNGDGKGDGLGFFLDPTPNDNSEFQGEIRNAFVAYPTPGGSADNKADLFNLVTIEMAHVLGLENRYPGLAWRQNISGYLQDTGVLDVRDTPGHLWAFNGPSGRALFTTNNAGLSDTQYPIHTAFPPNNITFGGFNYIGVEDVGTAGGSSCCERTLPSNLMARALADVYGYTIALPETFGTFYTVLDSSGRLTIRGTGGNDSVYLFRQGSQLGVYMDPGTDVAGTGLPNAFYSYFNLAQVSQVVFNAGAGDDTLTFDVSGGTVIPSNGIVFNGDSGTDKVALVGDVAQVFLTDDALTVGTLGIVNLFNDTVEQADLNGGPSNNSFSVSFWSGLATINGQGGTDTLVVNGTAGADSIEVYGSGVVLNGASITTTAVENTQVNAGAGNDFIYLINSAAGQTVTVNAGSGNDAVAISGNDGNLDTNKGALVVNGEGDSDTLGLWDNAVSFSGTYTITNTTVTRPFFGGLTYGTIENLTLNAANGDNTINVLLTAAGTSTTINAGGGNDTVGVGFCFFSCSLNGIQGPVTVNGQAGTDTLNWGESGSTTGQTYTVTATSLTRGGVAAVGYATVESVAVYGSDAADTINVNGAASGTQVTVNAGGGDDVIAVGGGNLNNLQSGLGLTDVIVNGQGGSDLLTVSDAFSAVGTTYGISSTLLSRNVPAGPFTFIDYFVSYGSIERGLTFTAGSGNDVLNVFPGGIGWPLTVSGRGGSDTLVVDDSASTVNETGAVSTTAVTGLHLAQGVSYNTIEAVQVKTGSGNDFVTNNVPAGSGITVTLNLDGGTDGVVFNGTNGDDQIRIRRVVTEAGVRAIAEINGQTFVNDYVGGEVVVVYAGKGDDTVTMDDTAGIRWQAEFYGEQGDDVLIGNQQDDTLDGGAGRDLLIGGLGADVLNGVKGGDILIGGTTAYDANTVALQAILAVWDSDRDYDERVDLLRHGVGPEHAYALNESTVFDDGVVDTLTGGAGRDWFPQAGNDLITDLADNERNR